MNDQHYVFPGLLTAGAAAALLAACNGSGYSGGSTTMSSASSTTTMAKPAMADLGLWIANGTNVLEYLPGQLHGGIAATPPHLVLGSASFGAPQGVTFDAAGNLWVMDPAGVVNGTPTPALFEFSAAQLTMLDTDNSPVPVATITSSALAFPQQSVFDAHGNLWVTDHNNDTVLVFTAAQLAMTGTNSLTPAVAITSAAFNGPLGIVFDAHGNLYVANNGGVPGANGAMSTVGTTIVEFSASQLPAPPATGMLTPELTPDATLSDDGKGSVQGPWALAFDAKGDLWSSNASAPFTLVEFAPAVLRQNGAPAPAVTISPTTVGVAADATLNSPNGICFDNIGDLAALNSVGAFGLALFEHTQLSTSAAPVPGTFVVGSATMLNAPAGCNFGAAVN